MVPNGWFHAEFSWTIDGDAVGKIWDSGNNLISTLVVDTQGESSDASVIEHIQVYGWQGAVFDNIEVSPEPSTAVLLGIGALCLVLHCHKRR